MKYVQMQPDVAQVCLDEVTRKLEVEKETKRLVEEAAKNYAEEVGKRQVKLL